MSVEFIQQRARSLFRKMLKASLQNTATIGMRREIVYIAPERIHKSKTVSRYPFNEFLNNLDHSKEAEDELI